MKKTRLYAWTIVVLAVLLSSCTNDDLKMDELALHSKSFTEKPILLTDTLQDAIAIEETPELKELKDRFEELKKSKISARYMDDEYDNTLWYNLYAIREQNIQITTESNGNNSYLSTNGKGKELTFDTRRRTSDQYFYIKVLPASSGIPYLIYSRQENTPIVVGHYTNIPDNKILITKNDNTGSLFGASWDFVPANGSLAIQSQDIIGQGSSGHWMDIFNYTTEVGANNKTSMSQYTKLAKQHFKITPSTTFTMTKVKYVNEYSARITNNSRHLVKEAYTNNLSSYKEHTMFLNDNVYASSNFKEKVRNINFSVNIPYDFKVKAPEVVGGNVLIEPSVNSPATLSYVPNSYQNNRTDLSTELLLYVKPRTRVDVFYYYSAYDLEVEYEAISTSGDREIKFAGTWVGRIYVDDIPDEHYLIETNLDTQQTRQIHFNSSNKKQRINL